MFLPFLLQANDLPQVRKEYYSAVNNEKSAEKFYESLKKRNPTDPVIMAYFGSAEAIMARHAINPYKKLSYLKSGTKRLNSAVSKAPDNLEIRFLRFSLEHYVPSFLGYSKHLQADKNKIVELVRQRKFGEMDGALLANLVNFMKETKRCSPQEMAILAQAINNG